MSYGSCSTRRNNAESRSVPSICCLGPAPFCTLVKPLNSDQAVRGAKASCSGSSQASITLRSHDAGRTLAFTASTIRWWACAGGSSRDFIAAISPSVRSRMDET